MHPQFLFSSVSNVQTILTILLQTQLLHSKGWHSSSNNSHQIWPDPETPCCEFSFFFFPFYHGTNLECWEALKGRALKKGMTRDRQWSDLDGLFLEGLTSGRVHARFEGSHEAHFVCTMPRRLWEWFREGLDSSRSWDLSLSLNARPVDL